MTTVLICPLLVQPVYSKLGRWLAVDKNSGFLTDIFDFHRTKRKFSLIKTVTSFLKVF